MKQTVKNVIWSFGGFVLLGLVAYVLINYWTYIFAKTISGTVLRVERVTELTALINSPQADPTQMYSFAVAVRDEKGEIWTASGDDRKWAVVQANQCVEARFYPYPPWELGKSGTYNNARLIRIFDCKPTSP